MIRKGPLTLALAIAVGLAASALIRWWPQAGLRLALTPVVAAVLTDAGSPRSGSTAADVTVVVFTDYQCPICKATDCKVNVPPPPKPSASIRPSKVSTPRSKGGASVERATDKPS